MHLLFMENLRELISIVKPNLLLSIMPCRGDIFVTLRLEYIINLANIVYLTIFDCSHHYDYKMVYRLIYYT